MTKLTASEERVALDAAKTGDSSAVYSLLNVYSGIIRSAARRFYIRSGEEELYQSGCIGFLCAIERYKADCGVRLMTYALPWILGEMKKTARQLLMTKDDRSFEADSESQSFEETLGCDDIGFSKLDIRMALERLKPQDRTLIILRYFRDYTQKETALLLRMSQSQISKAERRILDALRIQLTP